MGEEENMKIELRLSLYFWSRGVGRFFYVIFNFFVFLGYGVDNLIILFDFIFCLEFIFSLFLVCLIDFYFLVVNFNM